MPQQLSLQIKLNDDATFENFLVPAGDSKHLLLTLLRDSWPQSDEPSVYLWGRPGSGVSHLLQASCHRAASSGLPVQYLPLRELMEYPPEAVLAELERLPLVAIDDIQAIADRDDWQEALFNLFNRVRDVGGHLLMGGDAAPRELPLALSDLRSRIGWGPVFQLEAPNDVQREEILKFRAARRGMTLEDEVARYLVNRAARDLHGLMDCLDTLEKTSLEAKRKLSIPFVKQVFSW
ncbi:DnaA regulatory inactivator Hda [Porticoccus sp.]|nr:MAG: DnaA regulatory inactivator Hda [Gammaproteobacteria bacterium]